MEEVITMRFMVGTAMADVRMLVVPWMVGGILLDPKSQAWGRVI